MLRGLRKASSNWLGKAVMAAVLGFLIISFAVWGIGDVSRGFVRSAVANTIATGLTAPKTLVEAVNRYQNEQRSIEYVLLDRAQAGEISAPAPEVLAKYYEDRKILFRAPEYRKAVVVALIPSEQARWI